MYDTGHWILGMVGRFFPVLNRADEKLAEFKCVAIYPAEGKDDAWNQSH